MSENGANRPGASTIRPGVTAVAMRELSIEMNWSIHETGELGLKVI